MKLRNYDGRTLEDALVTRKIDGVQCQLIDGKIVSRKNKPLYGINPEHLIEGNIYEAYKNNISETVSIIRTHNSPHLPKECIYSLDPVDERLKIAHCPLLEAPDVHKIMQATLSLGFEGLVIYTPEIIWKVKTKYSLDVRITGLQGGKNKNTGKLGAFLTTKGKVGIGIKDKDRVLFNDPRMIGEIIEVECMEMTPKGKMRHARFIRHRFDKDTEST